ncbi:hypothetical protein BC940DRAFT_297739 [Gongronella butleri]|nr:hypothetical protein BC940DRAFT_297739 [Gongronella butleri]
MLGSTPNNTIHSFFEKQRKGKGKSKARIESRQGNTHNDVANNDDAELAHALQLSRQEYEQEQCHLMESFGASSSSSSSSFARKGKSSSKSPSSSRSSEKLVLPVPRRRNSGMGSNNSNNKNSNSSSSSNGIVLTNNGFPDIDDDDWFQDEPTYKPIHRFDRQRTSSTSSSGTKSAKRTISNSNDEKLDDKSDHSLVALPKKKHKQAASSPKKTIAKRPSPLSDDDTKDTNQDTMLVPKKEIPNVELEIDDFQAFLEDCEDSDDAKDNVGVKVKPDVDMDDKPDVEIDDFQAFLQECDDDEVQAVANDDNRAMAKPAAVDDDDDMMRDYISAIGSRTTSKPSTRHPTISTAHQASTHLDNFVTHLDDQPAHTAPSRLILPEGKRGAPRRQTRLGMPKGRRLLESSDDEDTPGRAQNASTTNPPARRIVDDVDDDIFFSNMDDDLLASDSVSNAQKTKQMEKEKQKSAFNDSWPDINSYDDDAGSQCSVIDLIGPDDIYTQDYNDAYYDDDNVIDLLRGGTDVSSSTKTTTTTTAHQISNSHTSTYDPILDFFSDDDNDDDAFLHPSYSHTSNISNTSATYTTPALSSLSTPSIAAPSRRHDRVTTTSHGSHAFEDSSLTDFDFTTDVPTARPARTSMTSTHFHNNRMDVNDDDDDGYLSPLEGFTKLEEHMRSDPRYKGYFDQFDHQPATPSASRNRSRGRQSRGSSSNNNRRRSWRGGRRKNNAKKKG